MILQKIRRTKDEIDTFYETLLSTEDTTSRRALLAERRVLGPYGALFGRKNALRSLGARRTPGGSLHLILGSRELTQRSDKRRGERSDNRRSRGGSKKKVPVPATVMLLADVGSPGRRSGDVLTFTVWRENPDGRMSLATHADATQALIDYHGPGSF